MVDVLVVDWLGRGGIAQTSEAWLIELGAAGVGAAVVTRPGRELAEGAARAFVPTPQRNAVLGHRAVVRTAVDAIRRHRPAVVVIQNFVLPVLEKLVVDAAEEVSARVVFVVHDHRLHSRLAGTSLGLQPLLRRANTLVVHSPYVGRELQLKHEVVPHPLQLGMLEASGAPLVQAESNLCIQFGVLKRRYKNASLVAELAHSGLDGWQFASIGVGAERRPGLQAVDRFVAAGDLVATLRMARAVVLPYRFATQSGAVVLAQATGAVVLTTRVGGIPSQVDDGVDGLLLDVGADLAAWRAALRRLDSDTEWSTLRTRARQRVTAQHQVFREQILGLVSA